MVEEGGKIDDNKSTRGRAFRSAVMHTEDQADSSSSINTKERSVVEETGTQSRVRKSL